MRGLVKIALTVAAGWLGGEFVRRGRAVDGWRALSARQDLALMHAGAMNQTLRERLAVAAVQPSAPGECQLQVPLGDALPDALTIQLEPLEGFTEAEWEGWRAAVHDTARRLVGDRLDWKRRQEIGRLERMAHGVGPDAPPREGPA
jgi:hypothetical protein